MLWAQFSPPPRHTPQRESLAILADLLDHSGFLVCWFLLPIIGAFLTIPESHDGAARSTHRCDAQFVSCFECVYGIGGTAFGISIRLHWIFSYVEVIAVGLSATLGHTDPAAVRPHSRRAKLSEDTAGAGSFARITIGVLGIAFTGLARADERKRSHRAKQSRRIFPEQGPDPLSLLAGVLWRFTDFAFGGRGPDCRWASVLLRCHVWRGNVVYIFANTGAFITTAIYCLYLHYRHKTIGELVELPAGQEEGNLPVNFVMAAITGIFWYGQFFFYNLGHVRMGDKFAFTSWAIHMIMLVLFSNVMGVMLKKMDAMPPRDASHHRACVARAGGRRAGVDVWQLSGRSARNRRRLMKRYGSVIGVRAEKLEEYKKLHAAVWPDVLKMIKRCNIRNYSIYPRSFRTVNYYLVRLFRIHRFGLRGGYEDNGRRPNHSKMVVGVRALPEAA